MRTCSLRAALTTAGASRRCSTSSSPAAGPLTSFLSSCSSVGASVLRIKHPPPPHPALPRVGPDNTMLSATLSRWTTLWHGVAQDLQRGRASRRGARDPVRQPRSDALQSSVAHQWRVTNVRYALPPFILGLQLALRRPTQHVLRRAPPTTASLCSAALRHQCGRFQ